MIVFVALFFFIFSLIVALMEIEMEGKFGWAQKMPTWYRRNFLTRLTGKPTTGYHFFALFFWLLAFHIGFFIGLKWNIGREFQVLALYTLFALTEDFLWFVFNPNYGIKNFKKGRIWWHARWLLFVPIEYTFGMLCLAVFAYFSGAYGAQSMVYFGKILGFVALFTLLSIMLAPLYHKLYKNLRKKDDRKKIRIFH